MSYFLTLSCDLNYPNNSYSNFISCLDDPILLSGSFEVGISEIYFPNDFNVVLKGSIEHPDNFQPQNIAFFEHLKIFQKFDEQDELVFMNRSFDLIKTNFNLAFELFLNSIQIFFTLSDEFDQIKCLQEIALNFEIFQSNHDLFLKISQYVNFQALNSHILVDCKDKIYKIVNLISKNKVSAQNVFFFQQITAVLNFSVSQVDAFLMPKKVKKSYLIQLKDSEESRILFEKIFETFSAFLYCDKNEIFVKSSIKFEFKSSFFSILKDKIKVKKKEVVGITQCFYIFTDIISDNNFCNKLEPVLKIVKMEGSANEYISKCFERPHYFKVNKTLISKIRISIKDQDFNLVNFNSGPIIVKIHIRKSKK